jgi:hypothetical protein
MQNLNWKRNWRSKNKMENILADVRRCNKATFFIFLMGISLIVLVIIFGGSFK